MINSGNCGGTSLCYLGLAGCIRTEQARAGACLQLALVPRMIEAILPLRYTDNARFLAVARGVLADMAQFCGQWSRP